MKFHRKFIPYSSVIIFSAGIVILLSTKYQHHAKNLYEYTFHRAAYINRVIYTKHVVIDPTDSFYNQLIQDADLDDRRWGTANFDRPVTEQLSINYSPSGLKNYSTFMAEFFNKFSEEQNISDRLALKLNNFVHVNWLKNRGTPEFDPGEINQQQEKDRHPEDLIYYYVNYNCACGTISETSIALLRELGFRTRLMRVSIAPNKAIANHIFLEYYSNDSKKWVMFDAMYNLIPKRNGKLLSALEFFLDPKNEDKYKKLEILYPYAKPGYNVWFQKNGPIKSLFFLPM